MSDETKQPTADTPQPMADLGEALATSPEANRAPVAPPVEDADLAAIEEEAEDLGIMTWQPTAAQLKKTRGVGQPSVIDNRVVAVLIRELKKDRTVRSACRTAGISHASYYRAIERDPVFAELMDQASNYLSSLADDVIKRSLKDGDSVTARWYKDKRDERYKPQQLPANQFNQYNQFVIGDGRPEEDRRKQRDSSVVDTQPTE